MNVMMVMKLNSSLISASVES